MAAAKTKAKTTHQTDEAGTEDLHADYYRQLRAKVAKWADKANPAYREYLLLVPDVFHFLCRLMLDKRVEAKDKAVLGLAMAYVIGPFGLIPNVIPGLGLVDDLIVMVMALDTVLKRVPAAVVDEHWAGQASLFKVIKETLAKADRWVGKGLFARLKKMAEDQGFWPDSAMDDVVSAAKETASRATAAAGAAADAARSAMNPEKDRPRTPSRRPGQAGDGAGSKKAATKKKATKKSSTAKSTTKKATKKKAASKTVAGAAKKKTTKKKGARKTVAGATKKKAAKKKAAPRTIAPKKPKKSKDA